MSGNKTMRVHSTVKTPSGKIAVIYEGTGYHYFMALSKSKGDIGIMVKLLLTMLCRFDDSTVTEQMLDEIPLADVVYLSTVMLNIMGNIQDL